MGTIAPPPAQIFTMEKTVVWNVSVHLMNDVILPLDVLVSPLVSKYEIKRHTHIWTDWHILQTHTGNKSTLKLTTEIGIFFIFMIIILFNYYRNSSSQQGNDTTIGAPYSTKLGSTYCRNQVDSRDICLR